MKLQKKKQNLKHDLFVSKKEEPSMNYELSITN